MKGGAGIIGVASTGVGPTGDDDSTGKWWWKKFAATSEHAGDGSLCGSSGVEGMLIDRRIDRGVAGQDSVPSSEQSELSSSDDLESDATGSDCLDLFCKEDMSNKLAKPEVEWAFAFGVSFASCSDLPEAAADMSSRLIMDGDLAPLGGTEVSVAAVLFSACNADSNTRMRSSCRNRSNSRFLILCCAVASSRSMSQTPST